MASNRILVDERKHKWDWEKEEVLGKLAGSHEIFRKARGPPTRSLKSQRAGKYLFGCVCVVFSAFFILRKKGQILFFNAE